LAETIIMVILMIPIYVLLIWTYLYPEDSMLFGRRWMYEKYPEFSKEAISFTKFISVITMVGLTIALVSVLLDNYFLMFILILGLPTALILGVIKIFK